MIKKIRATTIVSSSAIGTASFPFDKAVNVAEVKRFSPQNRKLNGKIWNPFLAIS